MYNHKNLCFFDNNGVYHDLRDSRYITKKELQKKANKGKQVQLETFLQGDIVVSGLYVYRKEKIFKEKFYNIETYDYINIIRDLPDTIVYIDDNKIMYVF